MYEVSCLLQWPLFLKMNSCTFGSKTKRVYTTILWCKQQGLLVQTMCELPGEEPNIIELSQDPHGSWGCRVYVPWAVQNMQANHGWDAAMINQHPIFVERRQRSRQAIFIPHYVHVTPLCLWLIFLRSSAQCLVYSPMCFCTVSLMSCNLN